MNTHKVVRYYTTHEGGDWLPFVGGKAQVFHAIMLEDGTIYDAFNGWRCYNPSRLAALDKRHICDAGKQVVQDVEEIVNIVLEKLELVIRRTTCYSVSELKIVDNLTSGIAKLLRERRNDRTQD